MQCRVGSCLTILRAAAQGPIGSTYTFAGDVAGVTSPVDPFGQGGIISKKVTPGQKTITAIVPTGQLLDTVTCNAEYTANIASRSVNVTVESGTIVTCTFTFVGAPSDDRDGDGILNDVDACPDAAGPASTGGCPDRDGDNVPDSADACPEVAGSILFNGCPDPTTDSDHDGFSDSVETLYGSLPSDPSSFPIAPQGQLDGEAALATLTSEAVSTELACSKPERAVAGLTACAFQPGDIILWTSPGTSVSDTSVLEAFFGDTYFTHAVMVVGRFKLSPDADVTVNVADITPNRTTEFRIDPIGGEFADENSAGFLATLPEGERDCGGDCHYALGVYRPDQTREARETAARRLVDLAVGAGVSDSHDGWAVSGSIFYGGPGGLPRPDAWGPNGFYCSSLIAWAYGSTYDAWASTRDPSFFGVFGNAYITPDDLLEAFPSTLVTGFGTSYTSFKLWSPAHVLVTDSDGNRTGLSPDAQIFDEIPGSRWRLEDVNEGVSVKGHSPDWAVTLSGYESGTYVLEAVHGDSAAVTRHTIVGYTRPGLVETYRFGDIASLVGRLAAVDDTFDLDEQTSTALDVTANDIDPDDNIDPTALSIISPPTHGTADVVNGTIVYSAPDVTEPTSDEFTYRTCDDDGHCSEGIVTITIKPVNTAPNINVGDDPVVIEANTNGGWAGDLEAVAGTTATDPDHDPVTLSNDAPLLLPLGDTTVTWTADDGTDTTTAVQSVRVIDTTAPTIDQPPDVATHTADPHGTAVSYSPPGATDVADPAPTVTCSPGSGSMFAPGATSVSCTARDASGNETSVRFTVTVTVDPPPDDGCTIMGTDGNDLLIGTAGPDVICGYGGNDLIFGLDGDDTIYAGDGRDVVFAGDGDDTVEGGAGSDILFGGRGNDILIGGPGSDLLIGGPGRNRLTQ